MGKAGSASVLGLYPSPWRLYRDAQYRTTYAEWRGPGGVKWSPHRRGRRFWGYRRRSRRERRQPRWFILRPVPEIPQIPGESLTPPADPV